MRKKDILQKIAATFGDTRKMLEWAKGNNVAVERKPIDVINRVLGNLKGQQSNVKSMIGDMNKVGPFYWNRKNTVYIPRDKPLYSTLKTPVTNVLAHELGHAKDLKPGLMGWLRGKSLNSKFGRIAAERRANTQAIRNFISPKNRVNFSDNLHQGLGFASYSEQFPERLRTGFMHNFINNPIKVKYDPLRSVQKSN